MVTMVVVTVTFEFAFCLQPGCRLVLINFIGTCLTPIERNPLSKSPLSVTALRPAPTEQRVPSHEFSEMIPTGILPGVMAEIITVPDRIDGVFLFVVSTDLFSALDFSLRSLFYSFTEIAVASIDLALTSW